MNLQEKLNQQGMRLTRPRQEVADILKASKAPLTPQTIHQRAIERNCDIGLVSVYRTLDLLLELDLVRRVHGQDGCHGYVLASPGHHHHLICHKCGKAVEFSGSSDLSDFVKRIEEKTGFTIDEHILQLYGICQECQEKKNENTN
jgi:Fur family ferric uptake transcriptional regulator